MENDKRWERRAAARADEIAPRVVVDDLVLIHIIHLVFNPGGDDSRTLQLT